LKLPSWVIIFIGQFTTMLLIGLWHGITFNFAIWGAWHGIGLFINNRWSNWIGPRIAGRELSPWLEKTMKFGSWLLTFNFVSLGWVWFALPDPYTALSVFKSLFGI
jgi:alginate O-acetyltransferase complex protein AlgI